MLTKGLDNVPGTAGNDTIIGSITAAVPAGELDTLSTLDIVNGGAGIDTLKIATSIAAAGTPGLPNLSNVEIIEVEATAGVTIDTSAVTGLTNLNILKQGTNKVDATASATTDIAVTVKEDVSAATSLANVIKGGKNVTVTGTDLGNATAVQADTITVGGAGALAAAGDVVVNATGKAYADGALNSTLSAITVTGGKTVSVTQKATSDASAAAADTAIAVATNGVVTQGLVDVEGNALTTTVTVKQDASVAAVAAQTAKAVKAATQEVEFTDAKKGDTIELTFTGANKLKFTAKKDLSAADVASAFANLAVGDLQGKASAALGIYDDTGAGVQEWTSGAVQTVSATKAKVVFSNATDATPTGGNVITAVATKIGAGSTFAATASAVTAGEDKADAKTGVLGVANGQVLVDDAATAVIKTITIDGYGATSRIGTNVDTTVLETLNLSNSGHTFNAVGKATATADIVVDDTAATLALNLEKVGTANEAAAGNGVAVVTLATAPTTLNVKSTGNNYVNLTADLTETLNVSGTGLLDISSSTTDLAAVKAIKVTETAGLKLKGTENDTLTSVDTTGTTGTVTVSINGDKATYAGGAGVDNVTVTNPGTIISKAIDLGAGNDKLDLSAATPATPSVVLAGGTGDDTIKLLSADAASLSTGTTFAGKIDGFEKLEVTQALVNSTNEINLSNLDDIKYVISNGQVAGANANEVQTLAITSGVTATKTNAVQVLDITGLTVAGGGAGPFTVGGKTVTVANSDATDAIGALVVTAINGKTLTGLTEAVAASYTGGKVTITIDTRDVAAAAVATAAGTASFSAGTLPVAAATTGAGTTAYAANAPVITVAGVTVNTLVAQDKTAAGVAVLNSGDDTAAEVEAKIETAFAGNTAYTSVTDASGDVVFTFADAGNKDLLTITGAGGVAGTFTETSAGKFATEQTLKNMLDGGTLELLAAGSSTVVTMKDASALTDSFNIVTKAVNAANLGTVKVEGVETLNITTVDTDATVTGVSSNTLTLSGNKAQTITVKGDGNLSLTLAPASTEVKLIDASTLKGSLTVTTLAADTNATTVNGGDGADKLTAAGDNDVLNGGAGKDVLAVTGAAAFVKLTGGAGIDQFDLSGFTPSAGGSYASIRDLEAGETIKFVTHANANFNATKFVLGGAASFESYVSQAMGSATTANGGASHGIAWFQFTSEGQVNTYVVQDVDGDSAFTANDIVVEIVGAKDLGNSSFNATGEGTLLFI